MTAKYWLHSPRLERWSRLFVSRHAELGGKYVATAVYHRLVEGEDSSGERRDMIDVSHKNFFGDSEEEVIGQARAWLEDTFGHKVDIKRLD